MARLLFVFMLVIGPALAALQPPSPAQDTPARPASANADGVSPASIVRAFYEAGSGAAGSRHDWSRFRALFAPGARIVAAARDANKASVLRAQTVEDYITAATPNLESRGFEEREIGRREARYGDLAQIWSAYEATHGTGTQAVKVRGINSLQLAFADGRWWIVNVAWTNERSAGPLPAELTRTTDR